MKKCVIFCAAEFEKLAEPIDRSDLVIAADGGLRHTRMLGITPDVEIHLPDGDIGMYEFGDLNDVQLSKALEVMQSKLKK